MSGAQIAGEVHAALGSLAAELGSGAFSITLVRPAERANPWGAAGAENTFELVGNVQMYAKSEIDGTLIQAGDRKVMVSASGERPLASDNLRIDDKTHQIVSVDELSPQGVALYYTVQARA